jgi:CheY-like chemotaxis protein
MEGVMVLKSRVLVIDDDPEITESLREYIEAEGYEVDVAHNGKQGMVMQRKKPYELIITDIIMPEEDGFEVIMEVKFSYPMTKVIAISGGGCALDRLPQNGQGAGCGNGAHQTLQFCLAKGWYEGLRAQLGGRPAPRCV